MNKAKVLTWVVIVQCVFCLFFLLFAVVARQQAEKNWELAAMNEKKALEQKKKAEEIEMQLKRQLKECEEKNK